MALYVIAPGNELLINAGKVHLAKKKLSQVAQEKFGKSAKSLVSHQGFGGKIEIQSIKEEKDRATAMVKIIRRGKPYVKDHMHLIKKNGVWKILPGGKESPPTEKQLKNLAKVAQAMKKLAKAIEELIPEVKQGKIEKMRDLEKRMFLAVVKIMSKVVKE